MKNKKTTIAFNSGDILTFQQVFDNEIEPLSPSEFDKRKEDTERIHNKFIDTEEWRKHILWKTIKTEQIAVKIEDDKYEIKEIKYYSNNIKDIMHCQENLDALFKYHPLLNTFKYNSFTKKNEFNGEAYDEDRKPAEIFNFFKRNFNEWCPRTDIKESIQESLNNNEYHPIINYFNDIVWDGIERLETFMIDYYGAEDTKLNRVYFKRWMIALVKRILIPGSKFDSMLILAGEQGKKKTTLFNWLGTINGITYYAEVPDNLKDINNLVYATKGKLIMTFDDFDDICNKGDLGKVKSFVTKQVDTAALKWQHDKEYKVTYVLAATTNQYSILVDDATFDERRFWVIKVNPSGDMFDIPDYIKDQLYAEAYYLYCQDPNQHLWIWEKELKDEEIELQKQYKKANDDTMTETIVRIFKRKYPITNGMFKDEEEFKRLVAQQQYDTDNAFFEEDDQLEYIKVIPAAWITKYLQSDARGANRIVQILHTQGFNVEKKPRHWYHGIQLTCIIVKGGW